MFAWRNEGVAEIWLAPIAIMTYLLINAVPLILGCLAVQAWELCHEKADADDVDTTP